MSIRFKWHMSGFEALRTHGAVRKLVREQAEQIRDRANGMAATRGAEYDIGEDGILGDKAPRIRVSVHPANPRGMVDNQSHNTLMKAVGGGAR